MVVRFMLVLFLNLMLMFLKLVVVVVESVLMLLIVLSEFLSGCMSSCLVFLGDVEVNGMLIEMLEDENDGRNLRGS